MTSTADAQRTTDERRIEFVRLPPTVDIGNDRIVLVSLTNALAGKPSVLLADATATAFCDCAGVSALVCAHRRASAAGAQLRVVTASAEVRRIIKLTAASTILNVYPTIEDALADLTGKGVTLSPASAASASDSEEQREQRQRSDH
jgi:anti-sigma B factor antagonist